MIEFRKFTIFSVHSACIKKYFTHTVISIRPKNFCAAVKCDKLKNGQVPVCQNRSNEPTLSPPTKWPDKAIQDTVVYYNYFYLSLGCKRSTYLWWFTLSDKAGSLKINTALEYSTRVVQEGGRRCKRSTLNDLVHLTPLRIPSMNPPIVYWNT
jgi:hypothetical protein